MKKKLLASLSVVVVLTSVVFAGAGGGGGSVEVGFSASSASSASSVSRGEVVNEIMNFMKERYLGEDLGEGPLGEEELCKLACTYFYRGRYPRTITTATGENVTIYKPLERVVVLNTDIAETIRVLGAEGKIVGISDTIKKRPAFFPKISKRPVVGGWKEIDVEAVLQLEPDAVFAYGNWPGPEYIEEKLPPSVTVVRLDFFKPKELRDGLKTFGYFLEEEENASKYLEWHDKYAGEIKERVAEIRERRGGRKDEPIKVFLDKSAEESVNERKTFSEGTGMHQLCELAGGQNIAVTAELVGTYPTVATEKILEQDPAVIVGLSRKGGYETDDESGLKEEHERLVGLPGFDNLTAVENERVYLIDSSVAFGPSYPVGLAYLANWLYPEEFEDLDFNLDLNPQAILQEYLDNFCGIDFDLTKHGVFVFPGTGTEG